MFTRSSMALDIPLQKTVAGQQALSFLGPKIWTKICHSTNDEKRYIFFHTCSGEENTNQTVQVNRLVLNSK